MANKQQCYDQIGAYLRDKGIRRAAVLGSFARDEETSARDIDLPIEVRKGMSLFDCLNGRTRTKSLKQ